MVEFGVFGAFCMFVGIMMLVTPFTSSRQGFMNLGFGMFMVMVGILIVGLAFTAGK